MLPLTMHIAEKVHAYTRRYGPQQHPSTRVKDLVDLVLLATTTGFQAGELRSALDRVFAGRANHGMPAAFPTPPSTWDAPYARLAGPLIIPTDPHDAHQIVAALLDPILGRAVGDDARWEPSLRTWAAT